MLVFITIYLVSLVGMWCFYHFNAKLLDRGSTIFTILPTINTIMLFFALCYTITEANWNSINKKFFLIKDNE